MTIDKGKSWAIELDDIVKVQTDLPLLNKFTDDAAMQLKVAIESAFFDDSTIYHGMSTGNHGATAGVVSSGYDLGVDSSTYVEVSSTNVLDYIIDAGSVLDEANVPETGRWFVIPVWMAGLIKKSDIKDASLTGDGISPLRNGRIGMIDRFTLYSSNLLYNTSSVWWALFGTKDAISFATQLTETESLRSPDTFGDRVRGLQSYGYKVVKTDAYGAFVCKKAA
jgi:hypothetical protein